MVQFLSRVGSGGGWRRTVRRLDNVVHGGVISTRPFIIFQKFFQGHAA
jgi:hypothetical protein